MRHQVAQCQTAFRIIRVAYIIAEIFGNISVQIKQSLLNELHHTDG